MRKNIFRGLLILLLLAAVAKSTVGQGLVFKNFPQRSNLSIACWSIPDPPNGYISQIVLFETGSTGTSKLLWQSQLDNSYSPKIRFVREIQAHGLPLVLVERQTGAASSELDAIGKAAKRFVRVFHVDGFEFDVESLDRSKLPLIIAHRDANILDVPRIYRWNGSRFVEDSASHPRYYRELLAQDRKTLPSDTSAAVLVNLAQIALLSGNRASAKKILTRALAKERSKGRDANSETLRRIANALRTLASRSG